jgi:isoaspartyl peptidase/L-asparaginase-like protein (Ntn-hydrolase superfamily)
MFAIHGGAGTIRREDLMPEQEAAYRGALEAGQRVLNGGGDATVAVTAAIVTMEDNALFNAGKGAVFTTDAGHELDASIMDGGSLDTGAVTGVEHIKNPIRLADAVRTGSRHVRVERHRQRAAPVERDHPAGMYRGYVTRGRRGGDEDLRGRMSLRRASGRPRAARAPGGGTRAWSRRGRAACAG